MLYVVLDRVRLWYYLFTFLAYSNLKNSVRQSNVDLLVGKVNKTRTNVEV